MSRKYYFPHFCSEYFPKYFSLHRTDSYLQVYVLASFSHLAARIIYNPIKRRNCVKRSISIPKYCDTIYNQSNLFCHLNFSPICSNFRLSRFSKTRWWAFEKNWLLEIVMTLLFFIRGFQTSIKGRAVIKSIFSAITTR